MSFDLKDWQDDPDHSTPLSAIALKDLEERLAAYGAPSNDTPLADAGTGSPGTSDECARADHVHPSASGVLLPSGLWVVGILSSNASYIPVKNREYCLGLDLAPQRISRIAMAPGNNPDAGAKIRIALRADDGNMRPGAPVYEEAIDVTGATGAWKQTADMAYDHPGGLVWLSWVSQNWTTTGPSLRGDSPRLSNFVRPWAMAAWRSLANMPLGGSGDVCGTQEGVSGSLPTAFTPTNAWSQTAEFFIKRA